MKAQLQERFLETLVHPAKQGVGGEEHKGSSLAGLQQVKDDLRQTLLVAPLVRSGQIGWNHHQGLALEVEGRLETLEGEAVGGELEKAQPLTEKIRTPGDGERGRGENHGIQHIEERVAQVVSYRDRGDGEPEGCAVLPSPGLAVVKPAYLGIILEIIEAGEACESRGHAVTEALQLEQDTPLNILVDSRVLDGRARLVVQAADLLEVTANSKQVVPDGIPEVPPLRIGLVAHRPARAPPGALLQGQPLGLQQFLQVAKLVID